VIHCTYANKDAKGDAPYFLTSAWNLDTTASKAGKEDGFEVGLPSN
jgi:exo-1,4-beta-D-glucosaminidase